MVGAGAFFVTLIAGCETVSLDEPSETDVVVAARSDEPVIVPDVRAAQPAPSTLDDLATLGDAASGVIAPKIYRGTGVLARRPARRVARVAIEGNGSVTLNFANANIGGSPQSRRASGPRGDAYLEIEVIEPARGALPITRTGYRMHFTIPIRTRSRPQAIPSRQPAPAAAGDGRLAPSLIHRKAHGVKILLTKSPHDS